MKSLNVKNLTAIIFLFISLNASTEPMTAEKLYDWLNDNPAGKTFNINAFALGKPKGETVRTETVNDSVEFYQPFDGTLSPAEFKTEKPKGMSPGGFFLPDKLNQCTWVKADKNGNSIVISGRFSGCTFAWCVGDKGHLYTAHIYNVRGTTDQNIEAENLLKDSGAPGGAKVYGFRTAGRLQESTGEAKGYVIGTFVKGEWKWKWVTVTIANKIVSCSDITEWDTFPLADDLK